jgi:hypothetical protein
VFEIDGQNRDSHLTDDRHINIIRFLSFQKVICNVIVLTKICNDDNIHVE